MPRSAAGAIVARRARESEKNLRQSLAQVSRRLTLVAAHLDQPLQSHLELVELVAGWALLQVVLDLLQLLVAELTIDVAVELLQTVLAIHVESSARSCTIP